MTETSLPTALPPEPPPPTFTETPTTLPTFPPTPETTAESTPETTPETTLEATLEVTPEVTDLVTETPTATSTASATPLPPEPNWVLLSSGEFEMAAPPPEWIFGSDWRPLLVDGIYVFAPPVQGGSAMLAHAPLLDAAVQTRVRLDNGVFAFGLRQSETGGYTAIFGETGFLRLYRSGQEVAQMFLGPIAHQWRTLRLSAAGDVIRLSLDGAELITFVDSEPLPAGWTTLAGRRSVGSGFLLDDLSAWAAEGEAIQAAAPAALAAPMAYAAASEGVAGRITSSLAYTVGRLVMVGNDRYVYDFLTIVGLDGTVTTYDETPMWLAGAHPWSPDGQSLLVGDTTGIGIFTPSSASLVHRITPPVSDPYQYDSCPIWSPDGQQIAFLSTARDISYVTPDGYSYPRTAIYVVQTDGQSEPVRVALAADQTVLGCPAWSSAGGVLQIVADSYDQMADSTSFMTWTPGSSTPAQDSLTVAGWISRVIWSPDAHKVAFTQQVDCGCTRQLRVLDLESGTLTEVTNNTVYSYSGDTVWESSGTRLASVRRNEYTGVEELVIVDLGQSCSDCGVRVVSEGSGYSLAWSPDGQWLAVYDGYMTLIEANSGERLIVSEDTGWGVGGIAWNPIIADVCAPTDPNAPMAFSEGGEYCVPILEPCMGYPIDGDGDTVLVRKSPERVFDNDVGMLNGEGRQLLARWTVGTTQRWDDWYLVREPAGPNGFGWVRADVVYTTPRYDAACGLPTWDQPDAPANDAALPTATLQPLPPQPQEFNFSAFPLFSPSETHATLRLPAPFAVMPADDGATPGSTQGYGLNTYAFLNPDYYDGTNHIHSGLDFFYTESQDSIGQECAAGGITYDGLCFRIRAICDGLVYAISDPLSTGTGRRLSLRCTAPDGSLSNLYVVYNHLRGQVSDTEFSGGEWVSAGDILGGLRVFPYVTSNGVTVPHLHMEVFYHRGLYFTPETPSTIRLNPLLFFSRTLAEQIRSRMDPYYPTDSYTGTGEEKRYEWPDYDTADPSNIYAERMAYLRNAPDAPEDYDLGIDPLYNDPFTCLADTFPPVSDPANVWFREDAYPGIQQLGLINQPETPSQIIRSWSDLVIRLQQGQ